MHSWPAMLVCARALTVGGVDGRQVQREVAQRAVAAGGARGAGRLDDLQHHRLAVVAHRHLHAAETLRRRHACRAAPVPSSGMEEFIGKATSGFRLNRARKLGCLEKARQGVEKIE